MTHFGLFRHKGLLFGVNSLEKSKYEIQTALAGVDGQGNISVHIIVREKDQKEHEAHLETVMKFFKIYVYSQINFIADFCIYLL